MSFEGHTGSMLNRLQDMNEFTLVRSKRRLVDVTSVKLRRDDQDRTLKKGPHIF